MSKITLSQDFALNLFVYDTEGHLIWRHRPDKPDHVNKRYVGRRAGSWSKKNQAYQIYIDGKIYLAHRLIWAYHNGDLPTNCMVDHRDMNKSNNRIENLRLASNQENQRNRAHITGKQYKGVTETHSGRYKAEIRLDNKLEYLGIYDTPWEAALAYNCKAEEIHGSFFRPNVYKGEDLHS